MAIVLGTVGVVIVESTVDPEDFTPQEACAIQLMDAARQRGQFSDRATWYASGLGGDAAAPGYEGCFAGTP